MSLLGFDALGHLALGNFPDTASNTSMQADAGAFALTGKAASFTVSQAAAVVSYAFTGNAAPLKVSLSSGAGAFALTGKAATFAINYVASPGAYILTGKAANDVTTEDADTGTFVLSSPEARLERTGFDYEFQQGGIGHLLLEAERAKQLAAITRKAPPPVDLRSPLRFPPLASPPVAAPAPVLDMAAAQRQRMADEMRAAEVAKKRRRDEEAILLLAC